MRCYDNSSRESVADGLESCWRTIDLSISCRQDVKVEQEEGHSERTEAVDVLC